MKLATVLWLSDSEGVQTKKKKICIASQHGADQKAREREERRIGLGSKGAASQEGRQRGCVLTDLVRPT